MNRIGAEVRRLHEDAARRRNWKRFGPYLSERQWGTVREDYSADGDSWRYLSHDQARSRAYRFGEDGLLGFTDRECRLCFALALWNGRDPILKERLFGLTGPEGNHGEDVKELYYYLDATPTYAYTRALYKYPQREFPYAELVDVNGRRGRHEREFELTDTGAFAGERYFDVFLETAKVGPDDVLIRIRAHNCGDGPAPLHLLPTLWFRNTWSWGRRRDGHTGRPRLWQSSPTTFSADHETLGGFHLRFEEGGEALFTQNETNQARLFGVPNPTPYVKDAFHERVVHGRIDAVNPDRTGTKAALWYVREVPAGGEVELRLRLYAEGEGGDVDFDEVFRRRRAEADEFYAARIPASVSDDERNVMRQAYAGLLFTKQFFHYAVDEWLDGDPAYPAPPAARLGGRNSDWRHFFSRDLLSVPDKWEYPWFATWDLAFHMIPFADVDPHFAKEQLVLLLREWYMHPSGKLPAYEFAFDDVNPPVHAWAAWRVYKQCGRKGARDVTFLRRVFQKLLLNFTWWVNRKDQHGRHVFAGGFLGMDNIGVFDRSKPLPTGGHLEQADGTAWMAFYSATMMAIALELARHDPAAEDLASKFFEHFVHIVDAMNHLDGTGLWDEQDGFYYDHLDVNGRVFPLRVRSMVGLIPLFAAELIDEEALQCAPGFRKRLEWFLTNRPELARHVVTQDGGNGLRLVAMPSRERLVRILRVMLDPEEFLSPFGLRSLSKVHESRPFDFRVNGSEYRVGYVPGESDSGLFGGNSNWRGPIWFPVNYLILEALERYHRFYGDDLRVECPTGSGVFLNLKQVADEIARRLGRLFLRDAEGRRPCHGGDPRYAADPAFRDLLLFHEYFHGDDGRGLGASHQTGWTALVVRWLRDVCAREEGDEVLRTDTMSRGAPDGGVVRDRSRA